MGNISGFKEVDRNSEKEFLLIKGLKTGKKYIFHGQRRKLLFKPLDVWIVEFPFVIMVVP